MAENKKVVRITLHVGQQITGTVRTSVDTDLHKAKMTLTDAGVLIDGHMTKKLIPFSNIQGIDFDLNSDLSK